MSWLVFVLAGHLANAGAFLVDKILLTKRVQHPTVYVFFIGALQAVSFLLLPVAHFHLLPFGLLLESAIAGGTFIVALLCFFEALRRASASTVVPLVGALVPIWTLGFASVYLGEGLTGNQPYGLVLLIIGAVIISYDKEPHQTLELRAGAAAVAAAGFFAVSYTLTKAVFNDTTFLNGFLWMRLFSLLAVLPLLLLPVTRRGIWHSEKGNQRPGPLFLAGQIMGASGFLLLNVGLKLAPQVSIVNALQGIQYGFLFIMVLLFTVFAPSVLRERLRSQDIVRKIFALVVLAFGLMLVSI